MAALKVPDSIGIRYYLSVCTFGYTTVWWDWPRWEREIGWMARRGINMPLALTGQELIWQRVFRALGLGDDTIAGFFSGPAYLPWHRLGNLDCYMGPLSQDWIDKQADLQHKILDRVRELGMSPVVPGFSGFVPASFADHYPDVRLQSAEPWAGFKPTTYVDPLDPMFVEIGSRFVEEYRNEFGAVHHYLCETFAEQLPRIEPGYESEHLSAIGAATWTSLHRADPDAHWVMQGWPFHFGREFWTPDRAEALFKSVPDGRLIVLDQVTEAYEVWRNVPAVRERGWIHCVVHNYGQNTDLQGDLQGFADRAWQAISSPDKGRMLGMGIVPEGIDQNPIVYELLTDLMRSDSRIDVEQWIVKYVRNRYGCDSPAALQAWRLLLGSVYGPKRERTLHYSWRYRPGDQPILNDVDLPAVRQAVELLVKVPVEVTDNLQRDLVDVAKTWLGGVADLLLEKALADPNEQDAFFTALSDLDRLMATRPEHRLSTWLSAARKTAGDPADAGLFEHNARSLITHWGGPFLFDYATREWAGLILDFHAERWRLFFAGKAECLPDWERSWASCTSPPRESPPEDPVALVEELLTHYPKMESTRLVCHDLGLGSDLSKIELDKPRTLCGIAVFPMFGQGFMGDYTIQIGSDTWQAHGTCRGVRASFEAREVTQIRITIERILGELSQQFQVLVFSPSTQ